MPFARPLDRPDSAPTSRRTARVDGRHVARPRASGERAGVRRRGPLEHPRRPTRGSSSRRPATPGRSATSAVGRESGTGRVLDALAGLLDRFGLADPAETPDPDAPPFQGGLIGFFGYDLAPRLERLPRKAPRDSRLPDVRFALYDTAVAVDHATGAAWLVAADLLGEGRRAVERERLDAWRSALNRTPTPARRRGSARPARRATSRRTTTSTPSAGRSTTSPPATSSRSTSRSGSRPSASPTRSTSTCG